MKPSAQCCLCASPKTPALWAPTDCQPHPKKTQTTLRTGLGWEGETGAAETLLTSTKQQKNTNKLKTTASPQKAQSIPFQILRHQELGGRGVYQCAGTARHCQGSVCARTCPCRPASAVPCRGAMQAARTRMHIWTHVYGKERASSSSARELSAVTR